MATFLPWPCHFPMGKWVWETHVQADFLGTYKYDRRTKITFQRSTYWRFKMFAKYKVSFRRMPMVWRKAVCQKITGECFYEFRFIFKCGVCCDYCQKGPVGSRACRIGLAKWQNIKVADWKWHRIFMYAKHFCFHEQLLFSYVNPILVCYRVLTVGCG